MLLEFMGWDKASSIINASVRSAIKRKIVTQDIARAWGKKGFGTKEFADAVIRIINNS